MRSAIQKICIMIILALTFAHASGQQGKLIELKPEPGDDYILWYRTDDFLILGGLQSFLDLISEDCRESVKQKIDSVSHSGDSVFIYQFIGFAGKERSWCLLHTHVILWVLTMLDKGNVKIYDPASHGWLDQIYRTKEKVRSPHLFRYSDKSIVYRDPGGRRVFSFSLHQRSGCPSF